MKRTKGLRFGLVVLIAAMVATVLVGCGGEQATPESADTAEVEAYTSAALDASYDDALDASGQLALGTMMLEETESAVTGEQATALLPLWQALRGGVTAQAEVAAVLKQVEGTMTSQQLADIAAMHLTQQDLQDWMQEQGFGQGGGFPGAGGGQDVSPEERATRQAQFAGGEGGEMPPEMATRRAQFENMSEEEREAMRATAQAGGGFTGGGGGQGGQGGPGGRGGAGGRQYFIVLNPLIELLTARAGEA